ncbi:hypothetical protein EVAR_40772_1 [Eumeta japonica]|uniref:Uncharacterized protein n=1 Tax=Eumeta variegata TaxID=151549 RepID=A0A4C1X6D4_EUMVA|nr:hypothetical protein EVAR_40772_1 [Eumeta japonica]
MRAIRKQGGLADHGYSQPHRGHQCRPRIKIEYLIKEGIGRWKLGWSYAERSELPELSLAGRNTTAKSATAHLYSVKVSYLTAPVGPYSCCSQFGHSMAPPLLHYCFARKCRSGTSTNINRFRTPQRGCASLSQMYLFVSSALRRT